MSSFAPTGATGPLKPSPEASSALTWPQTSICPVPLVSAEQTDRLRHTRTEKVWGLLVGPKWAATACLRKHGECIMGKAGCFPQQQAAFEQFLHAGSGALQVIPHGLPVATRRC